MLGLWPGRGWWLCFPLWLRAGGSGVGLGDGPEMGLFVLVGWGRGFFVCCLAHRGSAVGLFSFAPVFRWCCSATRGSRGVGRGALFLSSPHLCFIIVVTCGLFVSRDGPLVGWRAFAWAERLVILGRGGGARLGSCGAGLDPQCFNADRSGAVLLLWFLTSACSCCPCLYFGSAVVLVAYFGEFWVAEWPHVWEGAVHSVCRGCLSWTAVGLCIWLFPFWF